MTKYTFCCNNCDYTCRMAGEPSALFAGKTEPVVCNNCHTVEDRLAAFDLPIRLMEEECYECNSTDYSLLYYINRPCPMCKTGQLNIDPNGEVIFAD